MDINLGQVQLTENQIAQSESLKQGHIKGFSFWGDGTCVVVTTKDLSEQEKSDLVSALLALPDEETQAEKDKKAKVKKVKDAFKTLGLTDSDLEVLNLK